MEKELKSVWKLAGEVKEEEEKLEDAWSTACENNDDG